MFFEQNFLTKKDNCFLTLTCAWLQYSLLIGEQRRYAGRIQRKSMRQLLLLR